MLLFQIQGNINKQPREKPNWLFIFCFLIKAYNMKKLIIRSGQLQLIIQLNEGRALIV